MQKIAPGVATGLNASLTSDGGLLAELQMVDDVVSTVSLYLYYHVLFFFPTPASFEC